MLPQPGKAEVLSPSLSSCALMVSVKLWEKGVLQKIKQVDLILGGLDVYMNNEIQRRESVILTKSKHEQEKLWVS